jgi:hypothetical protein
MKCNVINVVIGLFIAALAVLAGCGGSGSTGSNSNETARSLITNVGWLSENVAPDNSNNSPTCYLNVQVYYNNSISAADIDSFSVTSPDGWQWTITSPSSQLGTSSDGKPYIGGRLYYGAYPYSMPLAGSWVFQLKLKNGQISSLQKTLHEPGSSVAATHKYLYSSEDWTTPPDSSQYITALRRFPAQGYTPVYSAVNGGSIVTTGLSAVRTSFLASEPHAYNMKCWLYDANKAYLGYTITEFSPLDHSRTNLITATGELSIVPASTVSSTGQVDLTAVKYLRFVYLDGAQYETTSYSNADYRSISSLIAVNDFMQPQILASGLDSPVSLAVDSANVYWSETGAIKKASINGSAVTTLASGLNSPFDIAVDGSQVYWAEYYGISIKKVGLNGGAVTTLASTLANVSALALTGSSVVWPDVGIRMVGKNGGATTEIVSPLLSQGEYKVAVDADNVYWTEYGIGGKVRKSAFGSGTVTTLVSQEDYAGPIAVDSTDVYWLGGGALKKIGKNGGTVTILATGPGYNLALDATNIYWVAYIDGFPSSAEVRKIAKNGGPVTTLARIANISNYYGVAVDGTNVYWTESTMATNGGMIKTLPKNYR